MVHIRTQLVSVNSISKINKSELYSKYLAIFSKKLFIWFLNCFILGFDFKLLIDLVLYWVRYVCNCNVIFYLVVSGRVKIHLKLRMLKFKVLNVEY